MNSPGTTDLARLQHPTFEPAIYSRGADSQAGCHLVYRHQIVWRLCCLGGFLVGREAARRMVAQARGTILFTGASASLRGKPPFAAFASAKAGLRSLAQAMAREFGPKGVHVAHVVIDGGIGGERLRRFAEFVRAKGEDGLLDLDAIADAYWMLHAQHRTAWTHELDLRPYKEPF